MVTKNQRLGLLLLAAALLLLVPLIAMQFTDEVSWMLSDFLVAGILLFGTVLLCELILRKIRDFKFRVVLCVVLVVLFLLTWAELAVGIFGTPFAGS